MKIILGHSGKKPPWPGHKIYIIIKNVWQLLQRLQTPSVKIINRWCISPVIITDRNDDGSHFLSLLSLSLSLTDIWITHTLSFFLSLSLMGSPTVHCLLPAGGMVTSQNTAALLNAHLQPAGTKHAENTARRRVRVCIMPGHTIFLSSPWLLT